MTDFKWGIIGPGSIASDFAKDLEFADEQRQRVTAVLSRSEEHAKEFSTEFNVPFYTTDLYRFVNEGGMDAVYIATPHAQHYQYAITCLQHQIPVLCEKPLALNQYQVRELIFTATSNKTFLMEGMWVRFLPSTHEILSRLPEIGNITSIKARLSYRAPHDKEHQRFFDPELGGGSLLDLGIYPVFLTFLLLGKPTQIKAVGKLSLKSVDEGCAAVLKYAGSQYAIIESSLIDELDHHAYVYGEKGYIKIFPPWNEKPEKIELHIYNGETTMLPVEWNGKGLHFEASEVVRCLRDSKLDSSTFAAQASLDIMEIMDEIRKQIGVVYKADEMLIDKQSL
ncbi:MAG: Gfo/Idh/MocA family oxidoreductase [Chitinophagaceae bacterium]|nr:Gfo/Idh/MocA family oxidoreductase [Chitinophagaceae bacterium]